MAFNLFAIEGGGAAHTREKVVACSARRFVIAADESKFVERLMHPVPVEVLPFAARQVERRLRDLGGEPVLRLGKMKNEPATTDKENFVMDMDFGAIGDPPARPAVRPRGHGPPPARTRGREPRGIFLVPTQARNHFLDLINHARQFSRRGGYHILRSVLMIRECGNLMMRCVIVSENQRTFLVHVMKSILEPDVSFYVFQEFKSRAVDEEYLALYKSFIDIELPEFDSSFGYYPHF